MKVSPAFFRSESVSRLLERAVKAIALPMAIHYHAHDGNELHILGWGSCDVCTRANKSSKGTRACCESRTHAAKLALLQHTPITFVCHLGFTCVAVAALETSSYVITIGPYIPAEFSEEIAYDVSQGLRAIEGEIGPNDELPFFLDGVRTIPTGSISASAEWLVGTLSNEIATYIEGDDDFFPEPSAPEDNDSTNTAAETRQSDTRIADPEPWISLAALALVCDHTPIVTNSFSNKLVEALLSKRSSPESAQAFLVQAVSQVLDAARGMGGITESALNAYPAFVSELASIDDSKRMLKHAMRVLRKVRNDDKKPVPSYLPILVKEIHKKYMDDYKLSGFAKEQEVAASSVTRALECRINATFSEYLGRIRIEKAQQLLRDTQLSATAIGKRVGITDQSNFGKQFRKYTGISPGTYREQFQKKRKG